MVVPSELERLLPQARTVIRYLGGQPDGAAALPAIVAGARLSQRAARKAIRQLVTRYYLTMPATGVYALTEAGQQAAQTLGAPSETPLAPADTLPAQTVTEAARAETAPAAAIAPGGDTPHAADLRQRRTLTVVTPHALVAGSPAVLQAGVDASAPDQPLLGRTARLIVRLSAEDCRVEPRDRPLEVWMEAAGPLRFRVTPQRPGAHHFRFEVFQLVAPEGLRRVGGMICNLDADEHPTAQAAEVATLGAPITLFVE